MSSEYNAGYNAGIAAAAVFLKGRSDIWRDVFPAESSAIALEAEEILKLMRHR